MNSVSKLLMIEEMMKAGLITSDSAMELWADVTGMIVFNGVIMSKEEAFYHQILEMENEENKD